MRARSTVPLPYPLPGLIRNMCCWSVFPGDSHCDGPDWVSHSQIGYVELGHVRLDSVCSKTIRTANLSCDVSHVTSFSPIHIRTSPKANETLKSLDYDNSTRAENNHLEEHSWRSMWIDVDRRCQGL